MCGFMQPSAPPVVEIPDPAPPPQEPTAAPQAQDPAVSTSRQNERTRRLRASAANQTLVTGGQGLSTDASTGGKQLFGV